MGDGFRGVETRSKSVRPLVAQQRIGILPRRKRRHAHGHSRRKELTARANGGLLPRAVGVEHKNHGIGAFLEEANVIRRECRSLRRDGISESARMAANHVDLSFADDRFAAGRLDDVRGGLVEREKDAGLFKNRRLGGIDVFAG